MPSPTSEVRAGEATPTAARRPRVVVVYGTRPEFLKLAPVVRELRKLEDVDLTVVGSGQHRDLLDGHGAEPDIDLGVARRAWLPNGICTAVQDGLEALFEDLDPDLVLLQGDTTTAVAAALAALRTGSRIAHVEAGLRTGDRSRPFPEEIHRRVIGLVADWHFAPTDGNRDSLLAEGVDAARIIVTGNPVVEALAEALREEPSPIARRLLDELVATPFLLVTMHRRESFGAPMRSACGALRRFLDRHPAMLAVVPVHPNPAATAAVREVLGDHPRVRLVAPLAHGDFLAIASKAWLLVSDSGGLQEEAPSLGRPLLVLREVTERPEALTTGLVRLAGLDPRDVGEALEEAALPGSWAHRAAPILNPFGDGASAARIAEAVGRIVSGGVSATTTVRHPSAVECRTGAEDAVARGDRRRSVRLVIPVHNEEATLAASLDELLGAITELGDRHRLEILVIDDGSRDASAEIAARIAVRDVRVRLLRHEHNRGLGAAIRSGLAARGEYDAAVILDSDLSYDPSHVRRLLEEWSDSRADLVLASPYMPGGRVSNVPRLRRELSRFANAYLRTACTGRVATLTAMVRLYSRRAVTALDLRGDGADINVEAIEKALLLGLHIAEIPAHLCWRGEARDRAGRTSLRSLGLQTVTVLRSGPRLRRAAARGARTTPISTVEIPGEDRS